MAEHLRVLLNPWQIIYLKELNAYDQVECLFLLQELEAILEELTPANAPLLVHELHNPRCQPIIKAIGSLFRPRMDWTQFDLPVLKSLLCSPDYHLVNFLTPKPKPIEEKEDEGLQVPIPTTDNLLANLHAQLTVASQHNPNAATSLMKLHSIGWLYDWLQQVGEYSRDPEDRKAEYKQTLLENEYSYAMKHDLTYFNQLVGLNPNG